jgi:hypothetical protein
MSWDRMVGLPEGCLYCILGELQRGEEEKESSQEGGNAFDPENAQTRDEGHREQRRRLIIRL